MKGKLYAVGVGPGDPELLTLKAVNTIKKCKVIAIPVSGADRNIALDIVKEYINGKTILECDMPMTRDKDKLEKSHQKCAEDIAAVLDRGDDVAFLTLGDPSIYSTVMYIHDRLISMSYETAMIPGIPSFCAAAASLNVPLCERDEPLTIIPASYDWHRITDFNGTRVFMKSGKDIIKLRDELKGEKAMMVERASMDDEVIYRDISELKKPSSYFSLIVVKESAKGEQK